MSSFDAQLRMLIEEWIKAGDDRESMIYAMQREIERLTQEKNK